MQEEVYSGEQAERVSPSPVCLSPVEEPGFSGGIRVTAPFITKDPETGMRNVGMYSGHFRGDHKLIAGIAQTHHAHALSSPDRRAAKRSPCRWRSCLGALPDITYVSAANLPYGVDEIAVAGGIRQRPVDMVPCKTIPLEVPADAEIVIEGEISLDAMERGEPFSDYPGYLMAERGLRPVIDIKAITHAARRDLHGDSGRPAAERIQRHFAHLPRDDALQLSQIQLRHAGGVGSLLVRKWAAVGTGG